MRNSLRTQDRLTLWDVGVNTDLSLIRCALCDSQPDSHAHLFFECPFSAKVWSYVRGLAGMDFVPPILYGILLYLHPICNKRTALSMFGKIILAASSYYIWLERNNRLFKKGKRSSVEIRDIIMATGFSGGRTKAQTGSGIYRYRTDKTRASNQCKLDEYESGVNPKSTKFD
ncbi:reverse transcriptase zinc-binding domain-containing protein [Tanacetum coccineum]